jgi:hypothetical protein
MHQSQLCFSRAVGGDIRSGTERTTLVARAAINARNDAGCGILSRQTIIRSWMVAPGRVELPTFGLGNRCSIHLSYGAN